MNYIKTFKISKLALSTSLITSSIVYVTLSNTGEFTAYFADNSIKLVGLIGSCSVKIFFGDISSVIFSSTTNKLAEFIKTNIKSGSQLTALSASVLVGFISIILTIMLEFTYTHTKKYLIQDKQIEINNIDFEIDTIEDYEVITLKEKDI